VSLTSGEPSYVELGVPDADAARAFYGALLGWQPGTPSGPGSVETSTLGIGIHDGDDERHFEVFFAVVDLDASVALLTELGGGPVGEVHDSPGFGRWVECADDQGVRFGLRQPDDRE
jgi:predicted enzyme related to lactoylglutathione lyase